MARKKSVTLTRKRLVFIGAIMSALLLPSCQAVRTVTTTAETVKDGDKHTIIQTKVTESYVGKKQ